MVIYDATKVFWVKTSRRHEILVTGATLNAWQAWGDLTGSARQGSEEDARWLEKLCARARAARRGRNPA
jgi:hypothetical protein